MLHPSFHIAALFIYYLFSSRSRNCECGCGQNCHQNCDNPNNVPRFCRDCSDSESCKGEGDTKPGNTPVTSPKNGNDSPKIVPPKTPDRPKSNRQKIIVGTVVTVSLTATVTTPLIARAFFVPPMPNFALPGITVNSFDISTPNVIRANFQMRISSRNSNSLFRFYFDRLRIYVTYRDQQITFSTPLPPNAEGHDQTDTWTANVCGTPVTLEPNNAIALNQEQVTGSVKVTIRIVGRVRWKFWFFPSVKHRFSVKCSGSISVGTQQPQITVRKCSMKL